MGVFKKILLDGTDLGLLAVVALFTFGLSHVFDPLLSEIQASYFSVVLSTPDPLISLRELFYAPLSTFSDPLSLLALLVYGVLTLYLSLVVIGWIGKRRISLPENPFERALRIIPNAILLGAILLSPFILLVSLLLLSSSNTVLLMGFLAVSLIFIFVYMPIVSPALVSLVVDADSISDALRNGIIVGIRRWFLMVAYTVGISLITTAILLIPTIIPWASSFIFLLYQVVNFILSLAVFTELYLEDTYGE